MTQAIRAIHFVCSLLLVMNLTSCGSNQDVQAPISSVSPSGTAPGAPALSAGFNQVGGFDRSVRSVVSVNDGTGDIYVMGDFTAYGGRPVRPVVRLQPDGTLKDTFVLASSIQNRISSIAPADDGSGDLYVADSVVDQSSFPPTGIGHVQRVNPDGTIDPAFATGTITLASDAFPPDPDLRPVIRSLVPVGDQSGRVYAAVSGSYNGTEAGPVVRLNANGTLDSGFRQDRLLPAVFRIVPANDGSQDLYVATFRRDDPGTWLRAQLLRLNADGTVDPGFDTGNANYPEARIGLVVPVGDGSGDVFATGVFLNLALPNPGGPFALRGLVRFNPTGSVDATSPRPQVTVPTVLALAKAGDGSGDWLAAEAVDPSQIKVDRYKSDGIRDPGFTPGRISGSALSTILPAPDDNSEFYVGGAFSSYNGVGANNLVRVNRDGSL
jgi:hypothetical protein